MAFKKILLLFLFCCSQKKVVQFFTHNNLFYVNPSGLISLAFLPKKNNLFHVYPSYLIFGSLFKSFILLFTKELLHRSLEMICSVLITTTQAIKSLVCFIDKRKLFPKELFCYAGLFDFAASLWFLNMIDIYYYYYFFQGWPISIFCVKNRWFEKLISTWGCYPCRVQIRFSLFFSSFPWGWPSSWAQEGREGPGTKVGWEDDDASMQCLQTLQSIKYITSSYPIYLTKTKIAQWSNSKKLDKSKWKSGSKNCKPCLE